MEAILGSTNDVRKYTLYSTKSDAFSKEQCQALLPKIQMDISRFKSAAEQKHNDWQDEFFKKKNREPTIRDLSGAVETNYNRVLLARKLLREWKIRW